MPDDRKRQLLEICACFRNTSLVYGQWGFDPDSSGGKGLNLLFVGSSGTGKTMAAELIACSLDLDLHRIDLSNIVSKYVGETEKNLEAIFRRAQEANRILLFDEADALFGKRAEIRDSHDRYANLEVSYLLQKMEEYQGIAILNTNLRNNLDDAFLRRLHFVVEFPFPDEEQRLLIWRRVFPAEAPLQSDIDLAFMARQFRLAGGNIKNIALAAAFLAAYDGNSIEVKHLTRATRREYQKMGKLLTEQEFGPYFEMAMA
ncbi:MAG: ATP-binding protein [Chloroflexi bacterium]|nr:ATP-binding protein [Chloroflexota bacterium]